MEHTEKESPWGCHGSGAPTTKVTTTITTATPSNQEVAAATREARERKNRARESRHTGKIPAATPSGDTTAQGTGGAILKAPCIRIAIHDWRSLSIITTSNFILGELSANKSFFTKKVMPPAQWYNGSGQGRRRARWLWELQRVIGTSATRTRVTSVR